MITFRSAEGVSSGARPQVLHNLAFSDVLSRPVLGVLTGRESARHAFCAHV
jgi:hypothetical protein